MSDSRERVRETERERDDEGEEEKRKNRGWRQRRRETGRVKCFPITGVEEDRSCAPGST